MWAIKNKRTGKWWTGTMQHAVGETQITSDDKAILFEDFEHDDRYPKPDGKSSLDFLMQKRHMGRDYVAVKVKLVEVMPDDE